MVTTAQITYILLHRRTFCFQFLSELPEVLGMSDRIYIMNEGRFVGEVGKEEATSELIMSKIVKSGKGA